MKTIRSTQTDSSKPLLRNIACVFSPLISAMGVFILGSVFFFDSHRISLAWKAAREELPKMKTADTVEGSGAITAWKGISIFVALWLALFYPYISGYLFYARSSKASGGIGMLVGFVTAFLCLLCVIVTATSKSVATQISHSVFKYGLEAFVQRDKAAQREYGSKLAKIYLHLIQFEKECCGYEAKNDLTKDLKLDYFGIKKKPLIFTVDQKSWTVELRSQKIWANQTFPTSCLTKKKIKNSPVVQKEKSDQITMSLFVAATTLYGGEGHPDLNRQTCKEHAILDDETHVFVFSLWGQIVCLLLVFIQSLVGGFHAFGWLFGGGICGSLTRRQGGSKPRGRQAQGRGGGRDMKLKDFDNRKKPDPRGRSNDRGNDRGRSNDRDRGRSPNRR